MHKNLLAILLIMLLTWQVSPCTNIYAIKLNNDRINKTADLNNTQFLMQSLTKSINNQEQKIKEIELIMNNCINDKYILKEQEIDKICAKAIALIKDESCLLKINGPTIIVGDIHGDIKALKFCIHKFLIEANEGKNILFLGDYVDRGKNSVECAALVLKLKTMFPNQVFILRGNHEIKRVKSKHARERYASPKYGFLKEVREKYNNKDHVFKKLNNAFDYLSIAAIVNNSLFCVHGGISPYLNDLNTLSELKKPISYESLSEKGNEEIESLVMDLLWSDPSEVSDFEENTKRGRGKIFGSEQVNNFLSKFNLNHIVRGHQCVDGHDDKFKDGKFITIFSIPKYVGKSNKASVIDYVDGKISFVDIKYK